MALLLTLAVPACGGSGGLGSSAGNSGQMSLSVGDAPVDIAQKVVVEFTGVELLPNSGNPVDITFCAPKMIDLLNDSGTASAQLFDQPIPAGAYGQIRLTVVADGDPSHSYIVFSDGTVHGLQIPSGSESGLKLVSGFGHGRLGAAADGLHPGALSVCGLGNDAGGLQQRGGCGRSQSTDRLQSADASIIGHLLLSVHLPHAGDLDRRLYLSGGARHPDQPDGAVTFSPVTAGIAVTAGQTTTVDFP